MRGELARLGRLTCTVDALERDEKAARKETKRHLLEPTTDVDLHRRDVAPGALPGLWVLHSTGNGSCRSEHAVSRSRRTARTCVNPRTIAWPRRRSLSLLNAEGVPAPAPGHRD